MNPKENCGICRLKARIDIQYFWNRYLIFLSSFSTKYQNCINDDSKQPFTINRQLTKNKQLLLYLRDKSRLANWYNTLGYNDIVGFSQSLCTSDFIFSYPMTNLITILWYLPAHFPSPCAKGKRKMAWDSSPAGLTCCLSWEGPGRKQHSSLHGAAAQPDKTEQLQGLLQLWLPPFPRASPRRPQIEKSYLPFGALHS